MSVAKDKFWIADVCMEKKKFNGTPEKPDSKNKIKITQVTTVINATRGGQICHVGVWELGKKSLWCGVRQNHNEAGLKNLPAGFCRPEWAKSKSYKGEGEEFFVFFF